ncbi:Sepiapterin reductase [Oryzias melastigma]|uniref:Sepiapterin reductase n=1 Tax=Oryzias melastigma TaxID=30732 RepID=A0A3B3DN69_ORYME|nr:sepiapterin reductase a [Oryzias melastigma]KAF6724436.1 Sepiapterin reductase [Oryzias melastigma]
MPPSSDLGRALCIITGASRGFGRAVARDLSRLVQPGSVLVLAARSGDELRALQAELTASEAGRAGLKVQVAVADVGRTEGLETIIRTSVEAFSEDMDRVILVNNAASLGDVSRFTRSFTDMAEVDSYLSLNVSSSLCLTARVLQALPGRGGLKHTVVNVTSLCALQPFSSWVLYCTGKAAREMMFRVLAEEEPELRVLNYSPGPLDTEMQQEARSRTADPDVKMSFSKMKTRGQLLTCEESCAKLMKVLLEDSFSSGAHIDVYDV